MDYAAYQARYAAVPPTGNSNLWYSYDFGGIHFTCIDSEESQAPNSPQALWMEADLAAADANRATVPWVIMMQHRPVYSSTKSEAGDHTPGSGFPLVLEPYTSKYHVDLFLTVSSVCNCVFVCVCVSLAWYLTLLSPSPSRTNICIGP